MTHRNASGAALLAWSAALLLLGACGAGTPAPPAHDWTQDPRLVALLSPCPPRGHFDQDTSDLLPVLVEKLTTAQLDVARNVREDVAAAGEAAIDPLDALVRRAFGDRFGVPTLRNALAALKLSASPRARPILRRCLEHPVDEVRNAAAAGLGVHGLSEDYEALSYLLAPGASSIATRRTVVGALFHCDPGRLVRDAADWIAAGEQGDLWPELARCIAGLPEADDALRERLAALPDAVGEPTLVALLLAGGLRAGDEQALEPLRALLRDGTPAARTAALEALELAGRPQEILPGLDDPDPVLRARAASLVRPELPAEWARAALLGALNDSSPEVVQTALEALLSVGEPAAGDLAVTLLDGPRRQMEIALHALRENWEANPGLAERAAVVVLRRLDEGAGLPLGDRKAELQALGLVPAERAAARLLEIARAEAGAAPLDRMPPHRWVVRQAGNTETGRVAVRAAWGAEPDAVRRFDLLEAGAFGRDEANREFLLLVLHAERATPWERLYAAERLARQGPSTAVAPVLKRAALREQDPLVRPAFDCLMWRWYG